MLPVSGVPAKTIDSLYTIYSGVSVTDDECRPNQGGRGVVDERTNDLANLDDLDVTCGFDVNTVLLKRSQQASVGGGANDGAAET